MGASSFEGMALFIVNIVLFFESRSHSATCSDDAEISSTFVGMSLAASK